MKITPLIISYKSLEKLNKCIETIGPNIEILVIENSSEKKIKDYVEKHYKNCKVTLNNSNLGFSKASNVGLKLIKTDYALLINTDILIDESQINQIEKIIEKFHGDFTLATPLYDDLIDFNKNNNFDKNLNKKDLNIDNNEIKTKIDLIKGCSLIIDLKKFKDKDVFDENFFFFYEDIDLCKRVKDMKENIFVFNQIKIFHEGAKGVDQKISQNYSDFRHWNFFWAKFYYTKKHYGYPYALIMHISKLIRFTFNCLRYYFISKNEYKKNKFRLLGLVNSIFCRKSYLSKKILEK